MNSRLLSCNPLLITVATFSSLFGFSGLEHGFFELLQGNSKPEEYLISAIGPAQRFWEKGTETAFTLIPNYLITGFIAIAFSLSVIIWSLFFLRKKNAWIVLLLLSIAQFLTGGGFAQIFLSVTISIVAYRLFKPSLLLKRFLPEKARKLIAAPWIIFFILFILLFICSIEIAVFGFPFGISKPELTYQMMMISAYIMIIIFILTIIAAFFKESLKLENLI